MSCIALILRVQGHENCESSSCALFEGQIGHQGFCRYKKHSLDGGNEVRAMVRVFAVIFVLVMMASIGATAEQYKINKPIYGFYLGESKQSLLQRAKTEGVAYSLKGKIPSELFPDSYMFTSSLNKSEQVEYAVVSFYKDYVGQVTVYLRDKPENRFLQAAQVLDQSWNSMPGYSGQTFGPAYIITLPEVLVTLVEAKTETHIAYVHRGLMRKQGEERSKAMAK
jgi:hypothetical protein